MERNDAVVRTRRVVILALHDVNCRVQKVLRPADMVEIVMLRDDVARIAWPEALNIGTIKVRRDARLA